MSWETQLLRVFLTAHETKWRRARVISVFHFVSLSVWVDAYALSSGNCPHRCAPLCGMGETLPRTTAGKRRALRRRDTYSRADARPAGSCARRRAYAGERWRMDVEFNKPHRASHSRTRSSSRDAGRITQRVHTTVEMETGQNKPHGATNSRARGSSRDAGRITHRLMALRSQPSFIARSAA